MWKKFLTIILLAFGVFVYSASCSTGQKTRMIKDGCISGDCENGEGTYVNSDGSSYKGRWKNGKPDGRGTKIDADGKKYTGQFINGKANGTGTLYNPDGTIIKTGMWKDGKSVKQ